MRKIKWLLLYGLLFTVQSLLAQSNISGKIIGEKDGAPIAGATISVKNTRTSNGYRCRGFL